MSILLQVAELYKKDKDFKDYVKKYAIAHRMLPEDCFTHEMIIQAYLYYKNGALRLNRE